MSALFDDSGDFSTELLSDRDGKKEDFSVAEA
jgi:hypothetical protein